MNLKEFKKAGHAPTLLSAFFYFDVCFAVWVLNGAMAPFITEAFGLTAAQKGLLMSLPILSGALLRLPLGLLAQSWGRKNVSLIIMAVVAAGLFYGWKVADGYDGILLMGLLLGVGGASFGIALSLGSGWFPPQYKGLAMGITGAGNSGTVLAALFGPMLARRFGWQNVYGWALIPLLAAMLLLALFAKEPPDAERKTLKDYLAILWDRDTWVFNAMYVVTFGGFIGLTNFLPTLYHEQFGVDKVSAGRYTALVVLMGSAARVLGGWAADRWGGLRVLGGVFALTAAGAAAAGASPSLGLMTAALIVVFGALGVGNGSVFQLVPLRFPAATAVASSLIGEIGALGGALVPNAMTYSKASFGHFGLGFGVLILGGLAAWGALRWAAPRWTGSWLGEGGRARAAHPERPGRVVMVPAYAMEIY